MECWTQTISNSRISVFRGWMRFLTPGVAIVLSLNEPRARRMSFSCGMHSWPWKRWYPTTWRWGPSTHLWDLTARTWRGPFSVTAALCSSLLTKRGGHGTSTQEKVLCPSYSFSAQSWWVWDQALDMDTLQQISVSQSKTQYVLRIYPSWFPTLLEIKGGRAIIL